MMLSDNSKELGSQFSATKQLTFEFVGRSAFQLKMGLPNMHGAKTLDPPPVSYSWLSICRSLYAEAPPREALNKT